MKKIFLFFMLLVACGNPPMIIDDEQPRGESEEGSIDEEEHVQDETELTSSEQIAHHRAIRQAYWESFDEAIVRFTRSFGSDLEGIREKLEEAHQTGFVRSATPYNLAIIAEAQKDGEAARHYYEETLRQRPDFFMVNLNFAVFEARQGNFDEAEKRLRGMITNEYYSFHRDERIHNNLIVLYREKGDIEAAVDYAQGLLERGGLLRLAVFSLVNLLLERGEDLEDFVEEFGPFDDFHHQLMEVVLAYRQATNGLLDEAQAGINLLIESCSEDDGPAHCDTILIKALVVKGRLLLERGQRSEAQEVYEEALDIHEGIDERSSNSMIIGAAHKARFTLAMELTKRAIDLEFDSENDQEINDIAIEKSEIMSEVQKLIMRGPIGRMRVPTWNAAWSYLRARSHEDFADYFWEVLKREDLSEVQRERIKFRARDLDAQAVELYEASITADFVSEYSYRAARRLFERFPDEYDEPARWPIMKPPEGVEYITAPLITQKSVQW